MKHYQHILVATDLSIENQKVADKAKAIADRDDAMLSIVHVIGYTTAMYGAGEFAYPLEEKDVEASVQKRDQEALAREGERLGILPANQWLEKGNTADSLVMLINKLDIDLLVLGSHEHHGLGFLLGSSSNAIFHAMPCDVLAVRIQD